MMAAKVILEIFVLAVTIMDWKESYDVRSAYLIKCRIRIRIRDSLISKARLGDIPSWTSAD